MPRAARQAGRNLESFGTDLAHDLPRVTCWPQEIEEVVTALLDNAIAAMARSGRWVLDVQTYPGPGDVVIEVTDSGDGVPDALREKILDPAWKPPRGLLRARTIVVDGLGGSIGFTTTTGRGTTVLVRLPHSQITD
jgi:signal transduction histidine kinase